MRHYPALISLAGSFKVLAVLWAVLVTAGLLAAASSTQMLTSTPGMMGLVGSFIGVIISTAAMWATGEALLVLANLGEDVGAIRQATSGVQEDAEASRKHLAALKTTTGELGEKVEWAYGRLQSRFGDEQAQQRAGGAPPSPLE